MKKFVFTFGSVLCVCAALFMACEKTTNTSSTSGTTTSGTTAANSIVIDGTSHTVTTGTNTIGNNYVVMSNSAGGGYPSISLTFTNTSVPAAGSYTPSANYPASGNCSAVLTPTTSVTWTVVTCSMSVTSGSSRAVSFSNAHFTDGTNTHTVSVNLPF